MWSSVDIIVWNELSWCERINELPRDEPPAVTPRGWFFHTVRTCSCLRWWNHLPVETDSLTLLCSHYSVLAHLCPHRSHLQLPQVVELLSPLLSAVETQPILQDPLATKGVGKGVGKGVRKEASLPILHD